MAAAILRDAEVGIDAYNHFNYIRNFTPKPMTTVEVSDISGTCGWRRDRVTAVEVEKSVGDDYSVLAHVLVFARMLCLSAHYQARPESCSMPTNVVYMLPGRCVFGCEGRDRHEELADNCGDQHALAHPSGGQVPPALRHHRGDARAGSGKPGGWVDMGRKWTVQPLACRHVLTALWHKGLVGQD